MLVLIDNYDSFTYNLVQYFGDLGQNVAVYRNDKISAIELINLKPSGIIISPGPSDPDHAGICLEVIKRAHDHDIPLLGVCLGHQCLGQAMGGKIIKTKPLHGKISSITHKGNSVFKTLPSPLNVTRYHSLIIEKQTLPDSLEVTAWTADQIIMGVAHKTKPLHGVQFHPESIASMNGHEMLRNFINII